MISQHVLRLGHVQNGTGYAALGGVGLHGKLVANLQFTVPTCSCLRLAFNDKNKVEQNV